MSRILRINKQDVDIDDATAIGITLQAYDVKEPGQRKVNITNSFTIPLTANNNRLFGYPANIQSTDKTIYSPLVAEYWDGGFKIIDNSMVRVDEVTDRITLYLIQKTDIWDQLKQTTWPQFASEYVEWLAPTATAFYSPLIKSLVEAKSGLFIPCWLGQLSRLLQSGGASYVEDIANIHLQYNGINGGHMAIYAVDVFKFIEYKYGVSFFASGGAFGGNIFDDEYVKNSYTPIRSIGIKASYYSTGDFEGYQIAYLGNTFEPLDNGDKTDKTLYDFVTSFFQLFNVIVEEQGTEIRLSRWDKLAQQAPIDWTRKLSDSSIKFRPSIGGYAQVNRIKFESIFEGGSDLLNSKTINCLNKNLDAKADLFSIAANVPAFVMSYGGVIPDLAVPKTFDTFQFFISAYESQGVKARTTALIAIHHFDGVTAAVTLEYMEMPSVYSIENEYQLLSEVLKYPEWREVSCWLTINDIINLKFYAQYYFQQLGGCYFINKISGFNPQKSLVATKMELIKVSDSTPTTPPDAEYYVDGVNDGFTDGVNDLFY